MTVRVHCHTNLDDYQREEWPTEMVSVPLPNDWVEALSGKILRVVKITHAMRDGGRLSGPRFPIALVELHRC